MFMLPRARLPLAAFLLMSLVGLAGAGAIWMSAGRNEALRFAAVADEATGRLVERANHNLLLIDATAAIIEARGDSLTGREFAIYFDKLRLDAGTNQPGIAGLGYAPLLPPALAPALDRQLLAEYGPGVAIWPAPVGDEPIVPVAIMGSTNSPTRPALGHDMFSDPIRRTAIEWAIAARGPRATEPLTLATDKEPAPGFIVYAPVYAAGDAAPGRRIAPNAPVGFAFGGFRTGQLVEAALSGRPHLPVSLTVSDADAPDEALVVFGPTPAEGLGKPGVQRRSLEIAGQTWVLDFRPTAAFPASGGRHIALAFAAIAMGLAAAVAAVLRAQSRAHAAAEALAEASQRNAAEKDLLLQEMKHRIKNAIARILAIARQTATRAKDLDAFTATFTSRLQAMAEAQDMLTRSAGATADLGDLLARELTQVFGPDFGGERLQGPKVGLDATRTQALGLVFHELATNALKHGGGGSPEIDVRWSVDGAPGARRLELCWRERGGAIGPLGPTGFGTRLIDATLRHELGGEIERAWRPEGVDLRMALPLGPA